MSEKKPDSSSNGNESDQDLDFDPSAEMMVNDFDDEKTLEEEEALEEDNSNELDDLQREGEMPIEELLALYGNLPHNLTTTNSDEETAQSDTQLDTQSDVQPSENTSTSQLDNDQLTEQTLKFIEKIEPLPVSSNLSRLISTSEDALYEISDDEEYVEDDIPDWKRTIQVGQDYQASVPDSLSRYQETDCTLDSNSRLLWSPKQLNEKDIQNYLNSYLNRFEQVNCVPKLTTRNEVTSTIAHSVQTRDNEPALYILLANDFNIEMALSKADLDNGYVDSFTFIKPWSEEDCLTFEEGLRVHGKDFYQIQKNRLPNKTVNELVHFYYLWKKTERHDVFASKFKFEKRKYSLNPTITDLMDHFLDDNQPQQTSFNSTSSSLNSSHNHTPSHTKHHSSSLTLLPSHLSNHLSASRTDRTSITTTANVSSNDSNNLSSTTPNNVHIIEENSKQSIDSPTSKLIINEVISTNEDEEQSNDLVSSSLMSKSIAKEPIKSDECSISSTLNTNETELASATSEL